MKKMTRLLKFFWLYRCTSSQESCGGLIFDGNGIIRSPPSLTNANVYADNLDCRWLLGTGEARSNYSESRTKMIKIAKPKKVSDTVVLGRSLLNLINRKFMF